MQALTPHRKSTDRRCDGYSDGANGKQVHVTTVYRWINHGVRGFRLESIKVGGTTYTSVEAMQRFAEGLGPPATLSALPYSLARQREIERAAHEVNEMLGTRS